MVGVNDCQNLAIPSCNSAKLVGLYVVRKYCLREPQIFSIGLRSPQEQTLQEKPKRKRKRKLLKPDIKEEALEYQNKEQPPQEKHEKKRKRKLLTDMHGQVYYS